MRPKKNLPARAMITRANNSAGDFSSWKTPDLVEYIGGFSNPSKMPGFAYGIPAEECAVGSKLRAKSGTVCSGCYAFKGAYAWSNTKLAYYRRFDRLSLPFWAEAIAEVLNRKNRYSKPGFFRWHDSGDIQSVNHLAMICKVARLAPGIRFWIPTREYKIVGDYRKLHGDDSIPSNLVIRMSAHKLGGFAPSFTKPLTVSTVSKTPMEGAHDCPARFQENSCGDCRACWNPEVPHVDYHLH